MEPASPEGDGTARPASGLFAVDTLVRSRQLPGIDLHLRYAEWSSAGLVLHIAFYNNGATDLMFVGGVDPGSARLRGAVVETAAAHSPSFSSGIAPDGAWHAGGATNGTLTFAHAAGTSFTLEFPGFPPLPFRLDFPLSYSPEPSAPEPGTYQYGFEVRSESSVEAPLRIERLTIAEDALELELSLLQGPAELASFSAAETVLFDGRWNQYRPVNAGEVPPDAEPDLDMQGSAEGPSWLLRFPQPVAGDRLIVKLPQYPLIRLPLRPGDEAAWATAHDLPPSLEPRQVTAAPTLVPRSPEAQARDQVQELLSSLNRSVETRDRDAYLQLFVPEARDEQAAIFDRIDALPLDRILLAPHTHPGLGPASEATPELGRLADDRLQDVPAQWSYGIRDVAPENTFSGDVTLDFRSEGGAWRIERISGQLPFWARGPVEARRLGAFWIFYRPADEATIAAIGREAIVALDTIGALLPGRAVGPHVIFVTETPAEFASLTGRDGSHFLGLALSQYAITERGIDIDGAALYLNGAAFRSDPLQNRQQTVTHELTHLVLAPQTVPYMPVWLVEGMAMHVAGDLPVEAMRAAYSTTEEPSWDLPAFTRDRDFGLVSQSGDQTARDYAYAAFLTRYLIATYGFDRVVALYDAFAAVPIQDIRDDLDAAETPGDVEETMGLLAERLTAAHLDAVFGTDLVSLQRDFMVWLDAELARDE